MGDLGSIPGSGRSPGEGNGNPPQYSCLENPMEGVHGVAKSWIQLSDFTSFFLSFCCTFALDFYFKIILNAQEVTKISPVYPSVSFPRWLCFIKLIVQYQNQEINIGILCICISVSFFVFLFFFELLKTCIIVESLNHF